MAITRESIEKIAHLARIGFSEEELERVGKDLSGVLEYVDRLQQVNTQGVSEAASSLVKAEAFRPDVAEWCQADVLANVTENFPDSLQGLLKAPAVFDRPKK